MQWKLDTAVYIPKSKVEAMEENKSLRYWCARIDHLLEIIYGDDLENFSLSGRKKGKQKVKSISDNVVVSMLSKYHLNSLMYYTCTSLFHHPVFWSVVQ